MSQGFLDNLFTVGRIFVLFYCCHLPVIMLLSFRCVHFYPETQGYHKESLGKHSIARLRGCPYHQIVMYLKKFSLLEFS